MVKQAFDWHISGLSRWKFVSLASVLMICLSLTACNLFGEDDEEDDDDDDEPDVPWIGNSEVEKYFTMVDASAELFAGNDFFISDNGSELVEPNTARIVVPEVEYEIRFDTRVSYRYFRFAAREIDSMTPATGYFEVSASKDSDSKGSFYAFTIKYARTMPAQFYLLIEAEDADGNVTATREILITIAGGGSGGVLEGIGPAFKFNRDEFGRIIEIVSADGGRTKFAYGSDPVFSFTDTDEDDNLITPSTYDFKFDSKNRIVSYMTYYPNDGDRYKTTFEYDDAGHVVSDIQTYDDGFVDKAIYAWDEKGNLLTMTDTGYDGSRIEEKETYTFSYSQTPNKFKQPIICDGYNYSLFDETGYFGMNTPAYLPSSVSYLYEYYSLNGDKTTDRDSFSYTFELNDYNKLKSVKVINSDMSMDCIYVYGSGNGDRFDKLYPFFDSMTSRASLSVKSLRPFAPRKHRRH